MFAAATLGQSQPVPETHPRRSRRRHWRRWILGAILVLGVLVVVTAKVYIATLTKAPLALPTNVVSTPVGPLDGTWAIATGSEVGFRVEQTVMFMTGDVVGRTNDVDGSLVVSGDQVTSATFIIDLTTVRSGDGSLAQFDLSLDTKAYPTATFTIPQPIVLPPGFVTGAAGSAKVTGQLTMREITHEATVSISGRRDGSTIQVAGSMPIAFKDWAIEGPKGYGPLASVANNGTAEFLLVLEQA